jgi:hypothetical protein
MSVRFRDLLRFPNLTATPPSPSDGDMWWRSDVSQLHGSDGAAGQPIVLGPGGNLPVVRSGGWHSVPSSGAVSAIAPTINRAYAQPLWPGRECTLTGAAIEVTLLAVGNARAGVYQNTSGNVPGTLLADFGTVATGLLGVKTWTPTPVLLRPVLHWLVIVQQGLLSVSLRARDTWEPMVSDTSAVVSGYRNAYYVDGVSGALPGTFGAIAGTAQGPAAVVQLT